MAASVIWGGAMAGFSNRAGHLNFRAVHNNSKAGVNSVMRPRATSWITNRCINVFKLHQAPSTGKMKKVGSHNGVCATSPESGEIEPEVPLDHTQVDEAPDMTKKKLNVYGIPMTKVRVYNSYVKNHLADEQSYAQANDNKEVEKAIEVMRKILELEDMYRKESNSAQRLRPHQLDLLFALIVILLVGIRVSYTILSGVLYYPLILLDNLIYAIIELFKILLNKINTVNLLLYGKELK